MRGATERPVDRFEATSALPGILMAVQAPTGADHAGAVRAAPDGRVPATGRASPTRNQVDVPPMLVLVWSPSSCTGGRVHADPIGPRRPAAAPAPGRGEGVDGVSGGEVGQQGVRRVGRSLASGP